MRTLILNYEPLFSLWLLENASKHYFSEFGKPTPFHGPPMLKFPLLAGPKHNSDTANKRHRHKNGPNRDPLTSYIDQSNSKTTAGGMRFIKTFFPLYLRPIISSNTYVCAISRNWTRIAIDHSYIF